MGIKKWITKKEIADILKEYSVRTDEFERIGTDGYFFQSKYTKGYTVSVEPEVQHGSIRTGRVIVSHTQSGGKRTFQDVWERDAGNKIQFVFRNPWNKPLADYDHIRDLETQIFELKESGLKLQAQLEKCHEPAIDAKLTLETPEQLEQELTFLKSENKALRSQLDALTEEYDKLIKKTRHNARGAGRKADPAHLETQVKKVQDLLNSGHTPTEVQKIMGISRSSFFKYKKFTQAKDY